MQTTSKRVLPMKAPGVGSKFDFCRSVKLQAWVKEWDKRWGLDAGHDAGDTDRAFLAGTSVFPTLEINAQLTALRCLNSHVASWKRVSCEQQLDLSVFAHGQRDATDGM